jgi:hypothetical protein
MLVESNMKIVSTKDENEKMKIKSSNITFFSSQKILEPKL